MPSPLDGIKIVDLTRVLAGPFATRMLGDMGAQVIKIESKRKIDGLRAYGPWRGEPTEPEIGCGLFDLYNRNKLSISLDLTTPGGLDICKRLIGIGDIVVENYSVRGMKKFGLEYPVLQEINPGIIMISMAGMGQTGPYREYISFGPTLQALSGMSVLVGSPDGEPVIGKIPQRDNLYILTGLCSSGFGRGPMAGKLLADYIHTGDRPLVLSEADPARCVTAIA